MKVVAARVATLFKHREEGLENSRVTLNGSAQAELTETLGTAGVPSLILSQTAGGLARSPVNGGEPQVWELAHPKP